MTLSDEAAQAVTAVAKATATWGGILWAVATSHAVGIFLASVWSVLQIFFLIRDRVFKHRAAPRRARP